MDEFSSLKSLLKSSASKRFQAEDRGKNQPLTMRKRDQQSVKLCIISRLFRVLGMITSAAKRVDLKANLETGLNSPIGGRDPAGEQRRAISAPLANLSP